MPAAGRLIVLEGPEGAGKSTQLEALAAVLAAVGVDVLAVREPGGTALGDEVRRLLLHAGAVAPAAEALLFMASRAQLVAEGIEPALARGATVLVDRFFLATYAYQAAGRGLDAGLVQAANRLAVGALVPDLTLVLRVPPATGMARIARRGAADRMEASGDLFHRRVAAAYEGFLAPAWQRAHPECGAIVGVDATGAPGAVAQAVATALQARWPGSFPAELGARMARWAEERAGATSATGGH